MSATDICWLSVTELSRLVSLRELSPLEVVQAHLDRIDRLEPQLNCYITVCREAALAAAAAAAPGGRLAGVPVAVKDNVETAGVRSTGGSKLLAGYVPAEDAPAWGRLRQAGAILLGKANLHEFGMGSTSLNPHYGNSHNPWDVSRVPGGSSGGSAAAVAAGLAPAALGTDAGGSVRIPAALCGVVGLKPTHGLVPVRGGIGFGNPTVDHIGPLTRTVLDAALLLALMAGVDPLDPTTQAPPRPGDYAGAARQGASTPDLRGLRVGVPQDHYFDTCHPEVEAAVRAAISHLEGLGASVEPVALPDHAALVAGMSGLGAEGLAYHGPWVRARLGDYAESSQARLLANQFILGSDVAKGLRARRLLRERYDAALAQVDLLAAPTVPVPAPSIAEAEQDGDPPNLPRNTSPANRTGLPAISVPCGLAGGLPVGLMLIGRSFEEETLLRAAAAYEATTEWHRLVPPVK